MSDVNATPGQPVVVVDSQVPNQAVQSSAGADEKPSWLDARLERERKAVLKELGLDSLEDAKKAVAAARADEEAKKSTAQKAAELEASLKSTKAEKDQLAEALSIYAKSQLSALTEAQRSAVAAVAGDDPAKQLKTIEALRPTWASVTAAAPVIAEKPKDTAPAPAAPKSEGTASSPPDSKAIHAELKKTNPVLAARFALANGLFENV